MDEGKLSLDDTVTKYFPAFTGDGREAITVRNLLTHTGGLPDMLPNDEMLREHQATLNDFRDGALKVPLKFKPNTSYSYASMGIHFVGGDRGKDHRQDVPGPGGGAGVQAAAHDQDRFWPARPAQGPDRAKPAGAGNDRGRQAELG